MMNKPTIHPVRRNVLLIDEERSIVISTVLTTFAYEVATLMTYTDEDTGEEVASPDWLEVVGFTTRAEALNHHTLQVTRLTPCRCPDCDGAGGWSGATMYDDADCQLCEGDGWLHQHQLDERLARRERERLTDDYIPF